METIQHSVVICEMLEALIETNEHMFQCHNHTMSEVISKVFRKATCQIMEIHRQFQKGDPENLESFVYSCLGKIDTVRQVTANIKEGDHFDFCCENAYIIGEMCSDVQILIAGMMKGYPIKTVFRNSKLVK